MATSWHSNKFLSPVQRRGGAADPAFERLPDCRTRRCWPALAEEELEQLLRGYGYTPYFVQGDDPFARQLDPEPMHQKMAATLDRCLAQIRKIQADARERGVTERPRWPMIVLRSPKGWTGPDTVDGKPVEGTFRAHQVPMADMNKPEHIKTSRLP